MVGRQFSRRTIALSALLVGAVTLGTLLVGCGDNNQTQKINGQAQEMTQNSGGPAPLINTIAVSGTGRVKAVPDEATIQVGVQNEGATAAEALDANSKDTQKVLDRLKAEGIADKDVATSGVVVYPNTYYDPQSGKEKTTGYRAQNTVVVTFHDLGIIGDIYAVVTDAGADSIYGPNWQLSENNAAVTAALAKAIANARMKAEAIAADQGVRLGEAVIISESSASNIYPLYLEKAYGVADGAGTVPPIIPQDIEVSADVTVTYRMSR